MKKNDERQICPPDTQCMSGFIGTILALVISVLAWVQKLSYVPSFAKQDCPEFCEFTRTIEKLREITVQAEAMSKPPPPTKKEEEDCICIRDDFNQMSDDERDNVQLLYVEPKKTKGSESCAKCCQKIPSGGKVLYVEAYGKDFGQKTSETQTTSAELRDGTTQPNVTVRLEKETQDSRDVKIGTAQASKVECTCDHTQVSDSSLPDSRKAQEENQLQATRREETVQDYDDRGGSYVAHKQYKASTDPKRSYLASKQSRSSEEEQIAAVYRTLISDDNYDAELEEEEENYFDSVCSELYRPCRQETPPYYQYQQVRQPQQARQPSPYTKRETVPMRQPRSPTYPSYEPSYKQAYECGRDEGGNPIYCYPPQQRTKPTQSFPRPVPVSYTSHPRETRPQKLAHQSLQRQYASKYDSPYHYGSRSPSSPSSKRSTTPVRDYEPDYSTSKHSMRSRTPPPATSSPRKRTSSPVRECEPECTESRRSASRERECELECPGSKHSIRGRSTTPSSSSSRKRTPVIRECELECPRSKHAIRNRMFPEDENVECIPQCPGYVQKYPRDDCIPECPGYTHRYRRVNPPQQSPRRLVRDCEVDCPGSKHSMRSRTPPKPDYGANEDGDVSDLQENVDCIPRCPGYGKRQPAKEECIPDCRRYKAREEEKLLRKECLDDCQGVQFQRASNRARNSPKTAQSPPKKSAGQSQKGKKAAKQNQKQTNAQPNGEFAFTDSGRMVAMMPNGAIPINPYAVQEFEVKKPASKRASSDPHY